MKTMKAIFVLALLLVTAACGGGGGGIAPVLPPATTTVSGVASAAIIKGGTVKVFKSYSSVTDKKVLGSGVTGNDGFYSINIGTYTGPVVVEVTGGSYVDEADGTAKSIPTNAPLRAAIGNASGTVSVAVTPLTELAVKQAKALDSKFGATSIDKANAQIAELFLKGVNIVATKPLDPSASITAGTQAQQDYTIALATVSKLAATKGVALDALLTDVAGKISGNGTIAPATAADLSAALTAFLGDTTNNKTGITTPSTTLQKIGKTTATVTIALTGSNVRSIETFITLPANVSVAANAGVVADGVLTSLVGGTQTSFGNSISGSTIHVMLNKPLPDPVIAAGDVIVLKADVDAGVAAPAVSSFTLSGTELKDANGVVVNAASLSVH